MNTFATSPASQMLTRPKHSFQDLRFVIIINNIIADRETSNLGNFKLGKLHCEYPWLVNIKISSWVDPSLWQRDETTEL